ncbi:hypothetical protein HPP92_013603 [Vanilla planifolia]|uniref:Uncharacterized protein n=1 Tax=Vanilla planifolia TaxID=51239 RepID=A0A835UWW0_VANPL|nr:hypothetical protein HPP92_013603 [Vanilla planifolia]
MELLRFSLGLVLTGSGLSSGQIDGLITASANICSSITTEYFNKTIVELFSGDNLVRLLNAATSVQARIAVLGIASMVSPDDLGELHDRCIIFVIECTDLSDDQERKGLLSAVHRLMLDCGWFDELVEILTCILKTIAAGILAKFSADVPHQVFQSLKKKHKLPMKISTKIGFLNGKGSKFPDKSKIKKAFNLAAGIAWQLKELIVNVDMRKALLKSPNLEDAFYSLKIISQIFIEQCVNFEFFDTSPIVCLATLSLYLSLENDDSVILNDDVQSGSECMNSHVKYRILDNTLSSLLSWVEKIFDGVVVGQSGISPSRVKHNVDIPWQQPSRQKAGYDLSSDIPEAKGIENAMELCTSILKFIADIAAMNLVGHNDICCLRFASAYARYAISTIGGYRRKVSSFKEDDLKEIFEYLKSSFTYAAKFLHMILQHSNGFSSVPVEAFYLSNDLLDLVTAIEPYFGLKHAYQMISIAKPWLPVLLLGLGCHQLTKCTHQSDQPSFIDPGWHHYPTWLAVVSKAELREISDAKDGDNGGTTSEPETCAFTKLILTAVAMLQKGNPIVLDAIGCVLLVGLDVGLHARDFGLLFGLVHFIFVKLLGKEFTFWKELEQMTAYLQEIYPRFENELANPSLDEEEREKLEAAMDLLSSFFINSG